MDGLTDGHFYEWIIVRLRIFGNLKWPTRVTHDYGRTDGRTDEWTDGGVTKSILLFQKKRGLLET